MASMWAAVVRFASRPAARAVALVALLAALALAAVTVPIPDLAAIRSWVGSFGPLGIVVFVLVYAVAVPAPFPKSVLNAVAGLAFGIPVGASAVIVGATAGAIGAFLLGRRLGRDAVAELARGRLARVDALVERYGVTAAVAVRVVPVLPFTVLNYACGVTAMRLRHYAVGTAIGTVPGSTLSVLLSSMGARVSPWLPVLISVALATLTLCVGALLQRRRRGGASAG